VFEPPEDSPWIRLYILAGAAFRLTIGGNTNITRHTGVVLIQLFDRTGHGDLAVRTLADDVSALFRDTVLDGGTDEQIRFNTPYTQTVGADGGWYQLNCSIPYMRDSYF
jgi:hypothetical protein